MAELKAMMTFKKSDGKNTTISVLNADETIDATRINEVMDTVLSQNIFAPQQLDLVSKVEAKVVATASQVFSLA